MPTKTINEGNLYLTDGNASVSSNEISYTNYCVEIWTPIIEYDYNNPFINIPKPLSFGKQGSESTTTIIINLERSTETLSVTAGLLIDEATESAHTKRNNLITLANAKGALTVVFGTGSEQVVWQKSTKPYGVNVKGLKIKKSPGKVADSNLDTTPERVYEVTMTLIRGWCVADGAEP